ncbi:hypothetical protein BBJ28_00023326 [Nothophytophthora sp. Chile5]|nr:hypothetical protein BBJ28_00023326 [Nothophytophthora sp. Chile5]
MTGNKFERPTPVQMQAIPCVLLGHNVLVSAPTGSGKTASYLIPVISQILTTRAQEESEGSRSALVLAPIRELAMQIEGVAKLLMHGIPNMKTALLVGGFPVPTQRYRLQCGVQLIVATPGRFLDIFTNYAGGDVILEEIRTCVIDEVDVMLDVGFRSQISQIVALLSPVNGQRSQRGGVQILLFSATISDEVEMLVQQTLKTQSEQSYLRIEVGGNSSKASRDESSAAFPLNADIQQRVRWTEDKTKKKELFAFLAEKLEESTLVFVSSKIGATMLAEAIEKRCGIRAAAIHADKSQADRLAVLEAFVTLEVPVLVSTNVLSRGMDLLHVQNVVIFDFPKKVADYIHLIGRVGRGEAGNGNALVLVNQESRSLFRELIPLLRRTKTPVPREIYESLHSEEAKQRAQSSQVVIDESKRAFRVRKQLDDESGVEWKQWDSHCGKRQRTGF